MSSSILVKLLTPFINEFQLLPVNEAACPVPTRQDGLDDLPGDLLPLLVRECVVPFLQPQFSLSTKEQDEMYLEQKHPEKARVWSAKSLSAQIRVFRACWNPPENDPIC